MKSLTIYLISALLVFLSACSSCSDLPTQVDTQEKPVKTLNVDSLGRFSQGTVQKDLYYDILLENYPDNDKGWHGKSVAYLKRGDLAEGFRCVNKAVELDPLNNLGYRGWVKMYMFHDYEGALTDFHRLDSMTPGFQDAPWGEDIDKLMGVCYLEKEDYAKALKHFEECIEETESTAGLDWVEPRTFLYHAISLRNLGGKSEALASLDQLLKMSPDDPEALFEKATILWEEDQNQALELLETCKKHFDTQNTNPYYELPFQLYLSDIEQLKKHIKTHGN